MVLDALQLLSQGVMRSACRSAAGAAINLVGFNVLGLPLAMVLAFVVHLGVSGLWLGTICGHAFINVCFALVLWRTRWRDVAIKTGTLEEAMHVVDDPDDDEGADNDAKEQPRPTGGPLARRSLCLGAPVPASMPVRGMRMSDAAAATFAPVDTITVAQSVSLSDAANARQPGVVKYPVGKRVADSPTTDSDEETRTLAHRDARGSLIVWDLQIPLPV